MTAAQHTPTQRPTAPMCGDVASVPTVRVPGPCQERALVDAYHAVDAANHAARMLVRAASPETIRRATETYVREVNDRAARVCRHCGGPAVDRTGECQRCAIAAVEGG